MLSPHFLRGPNDSFGGPNFVRFVRERLLRRLKVTNLYFVLAAVVKGKTTQKHTLFFSSSSCNSLLLSFKAVSMSSFSILTTESVFLNSYKSRQRSFIEIVCCPFLVFHTMNCYPLNNLKYHYKQVNL